MLFLRIHSAEVRPSFTFYFEIKRGNILVNRGQRSLKNEGGGDLNLEPQYSDLFSFQERERERELSLWLKASLTRSSGQPWPRERQQSEFLEKVAAALTSSRAPVGSTERGEGGSGPAAMLAHRARSS